jgi:hypothetical protein
VGWPDHRLLLAPFARLCLLVLLAVGVAACGGNSAKTGDVDTPTLLAKTSERLNAVKSVHFSLAIDGAAYIDTTRTVQLRSAAGDIVVPDQMQTKIQIALGAANADVSLVTIGDDKYQTDLLTGRGGPAQAGFDYSPTVLFDRSQGLSSVVGKLRARVDRATIRPITSGAIEGDPVGAELWIAKDSYNLLKLVLTEPKTPDKDKPAVWTLTLDKYDQPVTIARPAQ